MTGKFSRQDETGDPVDNRICHISNTSQKPYLWYLYYLHL